ncbi:MAG: hypothetical protein ABIH28_01375 [archaeon]
MGLDTRLSESSKKILGIVCGRITPLDVTLYGEEGICTLEAESCEYCKLEKGVYFCYKKTYTLIPQNAS